MCVDCVFDFGSGRVRKWFRDTVIVGNGSDLEQTFVGAKVDTGTI